MQYIDKLGSPDTYEHYPTGWATAFSTPFQMFKRYAQFAGGTCDPMIISWPKGMKAKGQVRDQYHHATDVAATSVAWWYCSRTWPRALIPFGQEITIGSQVPPANWL